MPKISKEQKQKRNPERFRRLIEDALKKRDMSRSAVARRAAIDPGHFSRALEGDKSLGRDKVLALATFLAIPRNELLIAAGHEPEESPVNIDDLALVRSEYGLPLRVVTDPRFVDSVMFMWIFSQQPFRQVGIECELVKTDWANVPRMVGSANRPAIGFYNRRSTLRRGEKAYLQVNYWTDLCLYKGYALVARPRALKEDLKSIADAKKYLARLIEQRPGGPKPTIITMSGDTYWRLYTALTPLVETNAFAFEQILDPDLALRTFLTDGVGDLFFGGLPQRIAARASECREVLNFENNPLLFSLNSLIYSDTLQNRLGIVSAASGLWFKTIAQAMNDSAYRAMAQKGCMRLLQELEVEQHTLTEDLIGDVISGRKYEVFPERPTVLFNDVLEIFRRVSALKLPEPEMEKVYGELAETFDLRVDKEKYPALV